MSPCRTTRPSMTPARNIARMSLRTWRSQIRSSTVCINRSCGIASKHVGDVRLDHPPPTPPRLVDEDLEGIVRPAWAGTRSCTGGSRLRRPARSPSSSPPARCGHGPRESTTGACSVDPGLGIHTRRAGNGRYDPRLRSAANSSSSRDTPYSRRRRWSCGRCRRASVAAHLVHARSKTSLRWTLS